jgi:hypothetical protein
MNPSSEEQWVLTDAVWRGWAHQRRMHAQRIARKRTVFAAIVLAAAAFGSLLFRIVQN